jgi:putative tricarboxylic transport membrane protein
LAVRHAGLICSTLLGLGAACSGVEEEFPSRPIDVVTHASPGGGTDITARTMIVGARRALGVDMAVLFKGGGGGVVAMNYVDERPRDGYTLMAITPTHLFALARGQGALRIDDLIGVARATEDPLVVTASARGPVRSLADLAALGHRARRRHRSHRRPRTRARPRHPAQRRAVQRRRRGCSEPARRQYRRGRFEPERGAR